MHRLNGTFYGATLKRHAFAGFADMHEFMRFRVGGLPFLFAFAFKMLVPTYVGIEGTQTL